MIEKTVIAHQLPRLSGRFRLAIATNRAKDAAFEILDSTGIAGFFVSVMTLADAPPKPDPQMVLLAMLELGTAAGDTVFVGDKPSDRAAGRAAGVRTIMVDGDAGVEGCRAFLQEFG
jgi:HAD superfamily hydrolase (TIGR01549 family)